MLKELCVFGGQLPWMCDLEVSNRRLMLELIVHVGFLQGELRNHPCVIDLAALVLLIKLNEKEG